MLGEILLRNARILIVDDHENNVSLLKAILGSEGYTSLASTTDSRQVASIFASLQPDLILLDLSMPHLSGFDVMKQLKPMVTEGSYLPILVLTADITQEAKQQALSMGAKDFLSKPLDFTEVLLRIRNLLETRFLHAKLENQNQILEERVHERTQELLVAHKQLEAERTRLASILEQLPVGVFLAEGESARNTMHWSFVNRVGQEQLALPPSGLTDDYFSPSATMERPLSAAYHPSGLPYTEGEMPLQNLIWTGQGSPEQEMVFRYRSGEERVFLATSSLLQEKGGMREAVAVLQDITERKHMEQQKDDFITLASHELRTPLTVIKGYSQLARSSASQLSDKRLVRMLGIIEDRVDHLTHLANGLLDLSKLQHGTLLFDKREFDMGLLAQDIVKDMQVVAPEVTISIDALSAPMMVNADRLRIEEVLTNLVNNAIKYSGDSRKVEISIASRGDEVMTSVRDFGMGIPANQQRHIFERFFQAGNISAHQSGLGLGLFISRNIVMSHGGNMWFESSEGEVSTFYFSLPVA